MISLHEAHIALRNRALTAVVATTGTMALEATTTGYKRADLGGSFLEDNFRVGMEIVPAGFTANTVGVIKSLTATEIVTDGARSAQASGAGRSITVGIPAYRAYENLEFQPPPGRPYIEEEFVPGGGSMESMPTNVGRLRETGLYVIKWYGLPGRGTAAIRMGIEAIRARFAPGTSISIASGNLSTRVDMAAMPGQLVQDVRIGRPVQELTVPWIAGSWNEVAA